MKLTWFGGTALRIYVGGQIIVVDPESASAGVDQKELLSGADTVLNSNDDLPAVDPTSWRRKRMPRMTEDTPPTEIGRLGKAILIAAAGEAPLILLGDDELPQFGWWGDGAVLLLTSAQRRPVAEVAELLVVARPRLIAFADADDDALNRAVDDLADRLDGTAVMPLEPGLALEV